MPAIYKLCDWAKHIGVNNAFEQDRKKSEDEHWSKMSANPNAIRILEANQDKINWSKLSGNPNAIHLLEANQDKIDWYNLSSNPNAIHLLEANIDKIAWEVLSYYPFAIHLLEANQDKIDWDSLCSNRAAIHLLEDNLDKVVDGAGLDFLVDNYAALHLLERIYQEYDTEEDDYWWEELLNKNLKHFKAHYSVQYFMGLYERNIELINDISRIKRLPFIKKFIQENFELVPVKRYSDLYDKPWASQILMENADRVFHYELLTTMFFDFNEYEYSPFDQLPNFNNEFDGVIRSLCHYEWFETICEQYQDQVDQYTLSDMCEYEWLFPIVENQAHRFNVDCWEVVSRKEWAIDLLERNQDKVDIESLSRNKAIYSLDYSMMKQAIARLHEELMAYVYHPTRMAKWIDKYGLDREYLE